ncbi:MAG: diguanylate cyclase [Cyanobacteria bacterium P01_F01_bin.150]
MAKMIFRNFIQAYERFYQLLLRRLVLILFLLLVIGLGLAFSGTYYLSQNLVESQALQFAKVSAQTLNKARTLYSQNVVRRIQSMDDITVGAEYHALEGGIPNPATYTIELGEALSDPVNGMLFRLYSDYPFPNRQFTGGPRDDFQKEALAYLKSRPHDSFYRKEDFGDGLSFRYAEPVLMEPSCVACHNRLPNSPKKNWHVGDVRGILEISQPLNSAMLIAQDGLKITYGVLSSIVALAISGLFLIVERLRIVNQELEKKVADRTMALQRLANVDGLTQLANRRFFDETLDQEWRRARRQHLPLSLVLCDVDYFKKYNDTYGHQAGDQCLKSIANVLQQSIRRSGELAARYGGEEFAIILPNVAAAEALNIASHIRTKIHQLDLYHSASLTNSCVTISMGIGSIIPNARFSPDSLIKAADDALYQAKEEGRDRVVYTPGL